MPIAALSAVVVARVPRDAAQWLDRNLGSKGAAFALAFSSAGRRLGPMAIGPAGADHLLAAGLRVPASVGVDECGRVALLLAALASSPQNEHVELVRDLFRRGELRERQAVLRGLDALPDPARFVALAVDACRTNITSVFEAIACDNAYPARWLADAAFHQMVLKALFVGAPVARIVDLQRRTTDELVAMVNAYASERRAAGRAVPADVALFPGAR